MGQCLVNYTKFGLMARLSNLDNEHGHACQSSIVSMPWQIKQGDRNGHNHMLLDICQLANLYHFQENMSTIYSLLGQPLNYLLKV